MSSRGPQHTPVSRFNGNTTPMPAVHAAAGLQRAGFTPYDPEGYDSDAPTEEQPVVSPGWPYDPAEQTRRAVEQALAQDRARRRRAGGKAAALVLSALLLFGGAAGVYEASQSAGQPTPPPKVWVRPSPSASATATSGSSPSKKATPTTGANATPTPGATATPGTNPTPTPSPTQPPSPTPTPTLSPEYGQNVQAAQTYSGPGTGPQGQLPPGGANLYSCQSSGYDQLANPPQGDGAYVNASEVQLANGPNSLPTCGTASTGQAQANALAFIALSPYIIRINPYAQGASGPVSADMTY